MTKASHNVDKGNTSRPDALLDQMADIADEMASRFQAGEAVDVEAIVSRFPNQEELIRGTYESLRQVFGVRRDLEHLQTDPDEPDVRDNQMIGEYRIIRELGRGGMGIVYEAEQQSLNRRVALKVLPFAALLDSKRLQRFQNEARAAAQLKHPNIVGIHAVGCERGVHFFSMELIDGRSLATIIAEMSPLASTATKISSATANVDTQPIAELSTDISGDRRGHVRSVARLGIQAAEALHFAHQHGVIHRDVKPANLLLDRDGVLHVADFGLARLDTGSELTVTGDVLGTLRYMSPEQLEAGALVDQRTDIYSLGVTLYELVLGEPAFPAEQKQHLMRQILEDELPSIKSKDNFIPRDLANIIHKAACKQRDERYETAQALAEDLRRFLAHEPVKARPMSQLVRLSRWGHRNPVVAALSGLLLATLLITAIAGSAGSVHLARVSAERAEAAAATRLRLYASDIRRAANLLDEGDTLQAVDLLEQYNPSSAETTDYRNFEWFYLRSLCDELSPKWTFGRAIGAYDAAFSPDGSLLATCGFSTEIELWDIDSGQKLHTMQGHHKLTRRVLFAENGKTVLSCSIDGTIRTWSSQTGAEVVSARIHDEQAHALDLAISPDGRWLAALWLHNGQWNVKSPSPATIRVWDAETHEAITELVGPGVQEDGNGSGIGFSADGKYLIAGNEQGKLLVWNCDSWRLDRELSAHQNRITAVSWSPDGKHVATASQVRHSGFARGEIKIWNTSTWQVVRQVQHHDERIRSVDFSPDGHWLLVASADANVSIWNLDDGKCIRSFRAHAAQVASARMSRDGSLLATASGDNLAKVWKVSDLVKESQTHAVYRDVEGFIPSLVITPDNKSVITGDVTGRVTRRSLQTGEIEYQLDTREPSEWRIEVAVSPDSQWLAVARGKVGTNGDKEGDGEGEITIYHAATGDQFTQYSTPEPYLHGLEFSPDGQLLAFGSQHACHVFDWRTHEIKHTRDQFKYIKMIRWSPDMRHLVVSESVGTTWVFSMPDFKLLKKFMSDDGWGTIALGYAPDGKVFATGGGSRVIKIWDAGTFELLQTFDECPDWIAHVHFSPDGKRLLSTTKDGVLRVWHRELGVCLLSLYVTHRWPMNGRFSPDGKTIAAGADVLRIWRANDRFKPIPVNLPPNQPCPTAMELQVRETEAASDLGSDHSSAIKQ